jgi:hypothetical protein
MPSYAAATWTTARLTSIHFVHAALPWTSLSSAPPAGGRKVFTFARIPHIRANRIVCRDMATSKGGNFGIQAELTSKSTVRATSESTGSSPVEQRSALNELWSLFRPANHAPVAARAVSSVPPSSTSEFPRLRFGNNGHISRNGSGRDIGIQGAPGMSAPGPFGTIADDYSGGIAVAEPPAQPDDGCEPGPSPASAGQGARRPHRALMCKSRRRLPVFRIAGNGKLKFVRKYDQDTSGGRSLYWTWMVALP